MFIVFYGLGNAGTKCFVTITLALLYGGYAAIFARMELAGSVAQTIFRRWSRNHNRAVVSRIELGSVAA